MDGHIRTCQLISIELSSDWESHTVKVWTSLFSNCPCLQSKCAPPLNFVKSVPRFYQLNVNFVKDFKWFFTLYFRKLCFPILQPPHMLITTQSRLSWLKHNPIEKYARIKKETMCSYYYCYLMVVIKVLQNSILNYTYTKDRSEKPIVAGSGSVCCSRQPVSRAQILWYTFQIFYLIHSHVTIKTTQIILVLTKVKKKKTYPKLFHEFQRIVLVKTHKRSPMTHTTFFKRIN